MYDLWSKDTVIVRRATKRVNTLILFYSISPRALHWMNPTKARGQGNPLVLFVQVNLLRQGRVKSGFGETNRRYRARTLKVNCK